MTSETGVTIKTKVAIETGVTIETKVTIEPRVTIETKVTIEPEVTIETKVTIETGIPIENRYAFKAVTPAQAGVQRLSLNDKKLFTFTNRDKLQILRSDIISAWANNFVVDALLDDMRRPA